MVWLAFFVCGNVFFGVVPFLFVFLIVVYCLACFQPFVWLCVWLVFVHFCMVFAGCKSEFMQKVFSTKYYYMLW
jgi:hypothetical protein